MYGWRKACGLPEFLLSEKQCECWDHLYALSGVWYHISQSLLLLLLSLCFVVCHHLWFLMYQMERKEKEMLQLSLLFSWPCSLSSHHSSVKINDQSLQLCYNYASSNDQDKVELISLWVYSAASWLMYTFVGQWLLIILIYWHERPFKASCHFGLSLV